MEQGAPAAEANQAKKNHCRGVGERNQGQERVARGWKSSACGTQGMVLSASLAKVQKLALQPPGYVISVCYLTFHILSSHL